MPKISVILTSFNHAKYIREAIDSVLNQTFTDFELIIWDDASEDDSWNIICSYDDPRIKPYRNDVTKRGIYGINKAISEVAKGEYIAIHHSDDVWQSKKLEMQLKYLEQHNDCGAVFSNALAITDDGVVLQDNAHIYSNIFAQNNRTRHEWLNHFFCHGNALCHPSVLIRKKCYEDCGVYRSGLAQLGDFDMWVRLCLRYEIYVFQEKLIKFRVRDNRENASGDTISMRSRLYFEYYLILKNFWNISSFSEFVSVFPRAEKYSFSDGEEMAFIIAMTFIEEGNFALSKMLAMEVLFDILNNPYRSARVREIYGFGAVEFVEFTKQWGLANKYVVEYEAEIFNYEEVIGKAVLERDCLSNEVERLVAERDMIFNTISWRVTRPLRILKRLITFNK